MPSAAAALDRLFFEVRVLNERHESHSLANCKKRIQEKNAVGLLLQKTLKRQKQEAKATAPQTAAQTLNEELKDSSSVQSYHVPCDPALTGLNAGCPLSSWTT